MRLSFGLWLFMDSGWTFNFFGKYFKIKFLNYRPPRDILEKWGFSYSDKALHLGWGIKNKIIWMPWDWGSCIRREVMDVNGNLVSELQFHHWENLPPKDNRKIYKEPYLYTTRNGEVQIVNAMFWVGEMEWRWRIFRKLIIGPKIINRSIWVEFDKPIGESVNSWKGGTTGCGYNLLPNESPVACLRRMERERKFP